jgi:hypothetical protein
MQSIYKTSNSGLFTGYIWLWLAPACEFEGSQVAGLVLGSPAQRLHTPCCFSHGSLLSRELSCRLDSNDIYMEWTCTVSNNQWSGTWPPWTCISSRLSFFTCYSTNFFTTSANSCLKRTCLPVEVTSRTCLPAWAWCSGGAQWYSLGSAIATWPLLLPRTQSSTI